METREDTGVGVRTAVPPVGFGFPSIPECLEIQVNQVFLVPASVTGSEEFGDCLGNAGIIGVIEDGGGIWRVNVAYLIP